MSPVARLVAASHLRRYWRSVLLLSVVTGLLGGAAIASFAGARRTDTAYDRLADAIGFPDASAQLLQTSPETLDRLREVDGVERVRHTTFAVGLIGGVDTVMLLPVQASPEPVTFQQIVEGRAADPRRVDEVTMSERLATELGIEVGDRLEHTALDPSEWRTLLEGTWEGSASGLETRLHVVGIARTPLDAITDDLPTIFGTPAYLDALQPTDDSPQSVWLDLDPARSVGEVLDEAGVDGADRGAAPDFRADRRKVDDAAGVLTNGLIVLGLVGIAATVATAGQLGARHADRLGSQLPVFASLGLPRAERRRIVLVSALPAGAVALLVAGTAALLASQLTPIGVTKGLEPSPGIELHLVGLVGGSAAVFLLTLAAAGIATSRTLRRDSRPPVRTASALNRLLSAGPVGSVALNLTDDRRTVISSRRVAMVGTGAALVGLVGLASFGASLDRFVTTPANWGEIADHEVNMPTPVRAETLAMLDQRDEIEALAEVTGGNIEIEDSVVSVFGFETRRGDIAPTVVDGRLPVGPGEVAVGPVLLERLGLEVGDAAEVAGEQHRVVGSALGFSADDGGFTNSVFLAGTEPSVSFASSEEYRFALVRYRPGVDPEAIAAELYGELEYGDATRPVSVTNLAGLRGVLPLVIGVVCVVGLAALLHLAFATAGQFRRDLAVLRAMGMARKQLARAVVIATVLMVGLASLVVAPFVVVLVRATWRASLSPTDLTAALGVPLAAVVLLGISLVLVVAVGRLAGAVSVRRPAGRVLRTE